MQIYVHLDGTVVAKGEADAAPPEGAKITFRMIVAKGGVAEGRLVTGIVSSDDPPEYDFETLAPKLVVNLAVHDVKACFE